MKVNKKPISKPVVIEDDNLQKLFDALKKGGYTIIGPTVKNGAVVYDQIDSCNELPRGWTDEQDSGKYRLQESASPAYFGYVAGVQSWKRFLFPPELTLLETERVSKSWKVKKNDNGAVPSYAFIGVRACELAAMEIQNKVFSAGSYVDVYYSAVRERALVIAVNCGRAGGTCFCASMGTGPEVTEGYDIALTEIADGKKHLFVADAGSERGLELLKQIPVKIAEDDDIASAKTIVAETTKRMGRTLDTANLKERLYKSIESSGWSTIANRCLGCANCTMVCPTCFCTSIADTTDLAGLTAQRVRQWDSCFSLEYSYVHGGYVRKSPESHYRQWMSHKLAYWMDQFGTFGCVGCGRCITWCPVGIDITAEAKAF